MRNRVVGFLIIIFLAYIQTVVIGDSDDYAMTSPGAYDEYGDSVTYNLSGVVFPTSGPSIETTQAPSTASDPDILLPFLESAGSTRFRFGVNENTDIRLQRSFKFLGTSYSSVYINGNGVMTFGSAPYGYRYRCRITRVGTPTISVFLAYANRYKGDGATTAALFYRQDTSRSSLDRVSRDVFKAFPALSGSVNLTWMLIVTWYNIPPDLDGFDRLRNTFQAVLTTDGINSFAILNYKSIQWPVPGYLPAEVGIYGRSSYNQSSYVIPGSCTNALLNITSMSNIETPGKFVFKVDQTVEQPLTTDNRLPSSFRNDWELLPFLESSAPPSFLFEGDNFVDMTLTQSFNFLGTNYAIAYVNENGLITFANGTGAPRHFCSPTGMPFPTISVFMADADIGKDSTNIAKILYREDTSRSSLDKVSVDVFQAFPALNGTLTLNWMLVVTWYNIPSRSSYSSFLRNTYQAVLTTDGCYSFVLFYYKEITWPEHKSEQKVEAGFFRGGNNTQASYLIPGSCTDALSNIHKMTNIGIPGKFVFRVDNDIESPTNSTSLGAPMLPPDFQGDLDQVPDSGESATMDPEIIDYDAPEVDHDLELLPHLESAGTRRFRFGDELHTHVHLDQAFNFLGRRYTTAYINGNGIITFTSGSGAHRYRCDYSAAFIPTISVYMADGHDVGDGHITAKLLYRQDTSRSSLDKVSRDVVTAFPELRGRLALNWTLVVTWSNIPPHHNYGSVNQTNTFQAVLTTDGDKSFVLFYYKSITWPSRRGSTAEVGIYGGRDNRENSFIIPGSCTRSLVNITEMSNFKRPGKFAFRVDQTVRHPSGLNPWDEFENDLELVPYLESAGSQRFYFEDDDHTNISLERSFNFLGTTYSTAYINGNGIITFHQGSRAFNLNCNTTAARVPTISVFLQDAHNNRGDGRTTAKLLYRQDTSRSSLEKVSRDVFTAFPNLNGSITLNWMLIVTWHNIPTRDDNLSYLRNTFQAVLTRDGNGTHSFVLFYYKKITWPNDGFDEDDTAEAGIFGGPNNFQSSYLIPGSCTHQLVNLTRTSNFGVPGKYAFRVDTAIGLPTPTAPVSSAAPLPDPRTPGMNVTEDNANGTLPFENDFDAIPYLNSSGSERFYFRDDDHVSVRLGQTFNFLGTNYSIAFVSGNGLISFGRGIPSFNYDCNKLTADYPTIAAYMEDADNGRGDGPTTAKLLYRQETSGPSLQKVSRDVLTAFPELTGRLNLTWMLLVSWDNIPPRANVGQDTLRNTFQAVLTSDGAQSFVLLYYKNITWPVNHMTAEAGIYGGLLSLQNSYLIPESCTPALINITSMSNIGVEGKFVFRVDSALRLPSISPCVPNLPSGLVQFQPSVLYAIGGGSLFSPHLNFCPNSDPPNVVTCVFYDGGRKSPVKVDGVLVPGQVAAVCPTPEFYNLGRIRVDMFLNFSTGPTISMHGFVIIVTPSYNSDLKVSTSGDHRRKFLEASWMEWSPLHVRVLGRTMNLANNLTFTLMELRGNRWSELYTFKDIPNTGVWRAQLPEQLEGILLSDKLEAPPTLFKMSGSIWINGKTSFEMEQLADISLATSELAKLKGDGDQVNIFDRRCQAWHEQEPTPPTDTLPCPTILEQASFDGRFTREGTKFSTVLNPLQFTQFLQINPSPSGAGSYCSYDAQGTLVIGYPYGSRLHRSSPFDGKNPWSYYWQDVLPYLQCCHLSYRKAHNCQKYYFAKRPPNTGVGYQYPLPFMMTSFAKVHFIGGATYQMNGTGHLWLLKHLGETQVQIWVDNRVAGNGGRSTTLGVSSAVIRSFGGNGSVTQFQVSASRHFGLLLWLDDQPLNFVMSAGFQTVSIFKKEFMLARGGITVKRHDMYELGFDFSSGVSLRLRFDHARDGGFFAIFGSISTALTGVVSGLMGTYEDINNGAQFCVSSRESLALVPEAAWIGTLLGVKNPDTRENNCHFVFEPTDFSLQTNRRYLERYFEKMANVSKWTVTPRTCGPPPRISNGGFTGNDSRMGASIQPYCDDGYTLSTRQNFSEIVSFTCVPDPHTSYYSSSKSAAWRSEMFFETLPSYRLTCEPRVEKRVKVSPSVVSILGSIPMTVAVPLVLDKTKVVKITCRFESALPALRTDVSGEIGQVLRDESEIRCSVPVLHTLGVMKIRVEVQYRGSPSMYFEGYFWVQKMEEEVSRQLIVSTEDSRVQLSWKAAHFNSTREDVASCELSVTLMQRRGQFLKEVASLWYPVCNSGEYTAGGHKLAGFDQNGFLETFTKSTVLVLQDIKTPNTGIGAAADPLSGILAVHEKMVTSENSFDLLCKQWYEQEKHRPVALDILPCPRSLTQVKADWRFSPEKVKVTLNPGAAAVFVQSTSSASKSGSQCAYDSQGALIFGSPGGSRVHRFSSHAWDRYWAHHTQDTLPYLFCCKWSQNVTSNCAQYFYGRRGIPVNSQGGMYTPPKFAGGWGTSHIQTFGEARYRVKDAGHFWMIKYESQKWHGREEFRCQGRILSDKNVSLIMSVAMQQTVEDHQVTIQVLRDHYSPTGFQVLVDGDLLDAGDLKVVYHEGLTIFNNGDKNSSQVVVVFRLGFSVKFMATKNFDGMNVIFSAGEDLLNQTRGLVGNLDTENKSELKWRVAQNESLFFWDISVQPDSLSVEVELEPDAADLADAALASFCNNSTACLFDRKATGSEEYTRAAHAAFTQLQGLIKASQSPVLECPSPKDLNTGQFLVHTLTPGSPLTLRCKNQNVQFTCIKISGNFAEWVSSTGEDFEDFVKSCFLGATFEQRDYGSAGILLTLIMLILLAALLAVVYKVVRGRSRRFQNAENAIYASVHYLPNEDSNLHEGDESVQLIELK